MDIEARDPTPVYYQLKSRLLQEILTGRYGGSGRLPTEYQMCERFGVSRTPVARALSELADEGVVIRHRRRGTFVNPHWLRRAPDDSALRVLAPDGGILHQHLQSVASPRSRLSVAEVDLNDIRATLLHAIAEGRAPDLAVMDSVLLPEFVASGFLLPLNELDPEWVNGPYRQDFLDPFLQAHQFDGQTYGVQAEMGMAGLWYRKADLERIGREPPQTWKQFLAVSRQLKSKGMRRHAAVFPAGPGSEELATYCISALLNSNGVSILTREEVSLNGGPAAEAMSFLRRLTDEGLIPSAALGYERSRPMAMLAHGETSMTFGASSDALTLMEDKDSDFARLGRTYGFIPVPRGPRDGHAVLVGGAVFCIPRQASHADEAIELIKAAVDDDALLRLCEQTGQIPPRRSTIALLTPRSPLQVNIDAVLAASTLRPVSSRYALISTQLRDMAEAVMTHRLTPGAAVRRAAELIGAITGLPQRPA